MSIASQLCIAHHSSSARLHERLTQASLQNWVHVSHLRRPVIRAAKSARRSDRRSPGTITARRFCKLAPKTRPSSSGSSIMQLGSDQGDHTRDAALAAAILGRLCRAAPTRARCAPERRGDNRRLRKER
eukprot:scaffold37707_cov69-Phaeocystis_antarctica.AAC.3